MKYGRPGECIREGAKNREERGAREGVVSDDEINEVDEGYDRRVGAATRALVEQLGRIRWVGVKL